VVPNKPNVNGEVYGFVRFSKVRDVSKLLKAVNAVCFGNFRVMAKVARFDRSADLVVKGEKVVEGVGGRGGDVMKGKRNFENEGEGGSVKGKEVGEGEKSVSLGKHGVSVVSMEAEGGCKGVGNVDVRVGNVLVPVRGGNLIGMETRVLEPVVKRKVDVGSVEGIEVGTNRGPEVGTQPFKQMVRKYRSQEEDLKWACNGVVASVINGEAILVVQNRLEDAGFTDLDIILMGADRVFIWSLSDANVM